LTEVYEVAFAKVSYNAGEGFGTYPAIPEKLSAPLNDRCFSVRYTAKGSAKANDVNDLGLQSGFQSDRFVQRPFELLVHFPGNHQADEFECSGIDLGLTQIPAAVKSQTAGTLQPAA
jgi:hypothetical protein